MISRQKHESGNVAPLYQQVSFISYSCILFDYSFSYCVTVQSFNRIVTTDVYLVKTMCHRNHLQKYNRFYLLQ